MICRFSVVAITANYEIGRLSETIEAAGALSIKMPVAYECIILMDPVDSSYKIESLMRRIADWHFAIQNLKHS